MATLNLLDTRLYRSCTSIQKINHYQQVRLHIFNAVYSEIQELMGHSLYFYIISNLLLQLALYMKAQHYLSTFPCLRSSIYI